MNECPVTLFRLSNSAPFADVEWPESPMAPGVYDIRDRDKVVCVGMAGKNVQGSLRHRFRDHCLEQIVNMFVQYLFLARVQFVPEEQIAHSREA